MNGDKQWATVKIKNIYILVTLKLKGKQGNIACFNQMSTLLFETFINVFSSNRPTGPIRSSSRNVRVFTCLCVPFSCTRF